MQHENPFLSAVGSGTMVADGLSIMNADYSSTSFRVSRVAIGPRNFLGNHIAYPAGAGPGDNCLLATKVMVPLDGAVREGVGLLGSPQLRDPPVGRARHRFDHVTDRRRAAPPAAREEPAQPRARSALFLLSRWLLRLRASPARPGGRRPVRGARPAALALALAPSLVMLFTVGYFVLVERAVGGFRPLQPDVLLDLRPVLLVARAVLEARARPLPARSSTAPRSRTWSGGCSASGSAGGSSTTAAHSPSGRWSRIGDDCTLNAGSKVQCHSQEDGAFKSDRSTLGAGCTLGVGAFVHYGVTIGDGAVLGADSFLMKGEEVPPRRPLGRKPRHGDAEASGVSAGPSARRSTRRARPTAPRPRAAAS